MSHILKARGLSFNYGGEPILSGIDFAIGRGDFIAVIGSNGAGKSTLLKLLLGELTCFGGEISLFGEDISRFSDWPKIGYVPQASPASVTGFPATAEEIVRSSLYSQIGALRPIRKRHREKARSALSLVGMAGYAGRMISELSGGQLQRVMIARALASDCELMLLDEPTSGIDAESSENLYNLLCELNRDGLTIMMVTHDMSRAAAFVSRTLCIEDGTVVELDREQLEHEIAHKHKHPRG